LYVVDDVDALHVLQCAAPVVPVLFDGDFEDSEGVVDPVVARERLTGVGLFEN
jgi:hypothetical protein